jgi:TRAP-type transport system small permease protein
LRLLREYSRLCHWLARTLILLSLVMLGVIAVALAVQVSTRYFLNISVGHTDEIAQAALVWMTFLGAAFLYREHGHIEVDLLVRLLPPRFAALIAILIEVAIIVCLAIIAEQTLQMRGLMQRVLYGNLQISRFTLHYVPLLIGSVCMILFAVENLLKTWRGAPRDSAWNG